MFVTVTRNSLSISHYFWSGNFFVYVSSIKAKNKNNIKDCINMIYHHQFLFFLLVIKLSICMLERRRLTVPSHVVSVPVIVIYGRYWKCPSCKFNEIKWHRAAQQFRCTLLTAAVGNVTDFRDYIRLLLWISWHLWIADF